MRSWPRYPCGFSPAKTLGPRVVGFGLFRVCGFGGFGLGFTVWGLGF